MRRSPPSPVACPGRVRSSSRAGVEPTWPAAWPKIPAFRASRRARWVAGSKPGDWPRYGVRAQSDEPPLVGSCTGWIKTQVRISSRSATVYTFFPSAGLTLTSLSSRAETWGTWLTFPTSCGSSSLMFTALAVYSRYDKYPHHALSLSRRARNHRRRRAGVSHGTNHHERRGESHDHDRQRVEHHLEMPASPAMASSYGPPAPESCPPSMWCKRRRTGRRPSTARGGGSARPARVRPAFSCRTTPAERCLLVADHDRCCRVHGE